jgi:putative membrane protein
MCLAIVSLVAAWSAIGPRDRFTWWLEVSPALIAIALLAYTYQSFRFTNLLYGLIGLHCIVLFVGGHYTYAEVPLFNWLRDTFHLARNHYDRLGHFVQGFVPAMVARELLLRKTPLQAGKWLAAIIVLSCLGISASYELFEWRVAVATGTAADAFLGTQGDPWDTQEDMFMALCGAVTALAALSRWHSRLLAKIAE